MNCSPKRRNCLLKNRPYRRFAEGRAPTPSMTGFAFGVIDALSRPAITPTRFLIIDIGCSMRPNVRFPLVFNEHEGVLSGLGIDGGDGV